MSYLIPETQSLLVILTWPECPLTCAPQHHSAAAPVDGVLGGDDPDVDGPLPPQPVVGHDVLHLVQPLTELGDELVNVIEETNRDILRSQNYYQPCCDLNKLSSPDGHLLASRRLRAFWNIRVSKYAKFPDHSWKGEFIPVFSLNLFRVTWLRWLSRRTPSSSLSPRTTRRKAWCHQRLRRLIWLEIFLL